MRFARSDFNFVRLVRGAVTTSQFSIPGNGQEVTDAKTGLIWQRCAEGMSWSGTTCTGQAKIYTHEESLILARNKAITSGVSWRLPNIKELASITDKNKPKPTIDSSAFPGTPTTQRYFWSSTPVESSPTYAWVGDFDMGGTEASHRTGISNYVRLVRAGQ
jgi:hypothetical protein